MGNPVILVWPSPLSIVQGTAVTVSGITYYGSGSYITIPQYALKVGNIYNIVGPGTFNYITFDGGSAGSYAASSDYLVYGTSPPYNDFPSALGQNVDYYNKGVITLTIAAASAISALVKNAVSKDTYYTFFPSTNTGQSTQTAIGYIYPTPNETTIPLQPFYSNPAISSMLRMSNTASSSPNTPSDDKIESFSSSSLSSNDPAYYPYDLNFHADDFTTSLNSTYVLPSVASFTTGTKYLLIKVSVNTPMTDLTLRLGCSATGILGVWVKWYGTINGILTSFGWYNASTDWQLSGGCQNGFSGNQYTWQISVNNYPEGAGPYSNYKTNTTTGYVYFNIQFTGSIPLNQILIQ